MSKQKNAQVLRLFAVTSRVSAASSRVYRIFAYGHGYMMLISGFRSDNDLVCACSSRVYTQPWTRVMGVDVCVDAKEQTVRVSRATLSVAASPDQGLEQVCFLVV